jgi:hypothetical protein
MSLLELLIAAKNINSLVTVTTFRKQLIAAVTISNKYLIVTVTMFKEHLMVTLLNKT